MLFKDLMDVGMLFQHRGPATEKAQSPKQVFDFRTFRSPFTSDRRRAPALDVDTPQRNMILDSPAQHHEETCRQGRLSLYPSCWRRCATSEIGGQRFFGSLGGRTKNILMIVMLKLANGFSD